MKHDGIAMEMVDGDILFIVLTTSVNPETGVTTER